MEIYKNAKSGKLAELVANNGEAVILRSKDGEERIIAPATLRRWWTPCDDGWEETMPTKAIEPMVIEENANVVELVTEKPKKEKAKKGKAKKEATKKEPKLKEDRSELHKIFLDFCQKMIEENKGITLFTSEKVKGFYSMKKDEKIYLAFTMSHKTGITLWLRSKAIKGICEYREMNHMFDARVIINDWSLETYGLIQKLHAESLNYQISK